MTYQVQYKYTKEQAASLRDRALQELVMPTVKSVFGQYPELVSATLFVAQYWSDEAADAVHGELRYSRLETLDLAAMAAAELSDDGEDPINLPAGVRNYNLPYIARWDSNGEAISLFAAFTKEDCHQEMTVSEAFSPYAIFRRRGANIVVEVVGTMIRPWLDGVRPSCEDET